MTRGGDEVEADVDPGVVVVEERALYLQLFLQVVFKLCVDIIHNRFIAERNRRCKKSALSQYAHI